MKKRKRPIIQVELEERDTIQPLLEDTRVEYTKLSNITICDLKDKRLVFDTVIFDHCTFQNNALDRAEFMDCVFQNCDFTNNTFQHSTFIRCEYYDSKLDGSHFVDSFLEHVLFKNSSARFLDIANTSLKCVEFIDTECSESSWFTTKLEHISLHNINLKKADFYETSLKNIDLSSCEIEGMKIDLHGIQGTTISQDQAVLLCNLIGVHVKE